jgi:hypothetical protein
MEVQTQTTSTIQHLVARRCKLSCLKIYVFNRALRACFMSESLSPILLKVFLFLLFVSFITPERVGMRPLQLRVKLGPALNSANPQMALSQARSVLLCCPIEELKEELISHPPPRLDRDGLELVDVPLGDTASETFERKHVALPAPAAAGELQRITTTNRLRVLWGLNVGSGKPRAHVVVDQAPPALVSEYYPVRLSVLADADLVSQGVLKFSLSRDCSAQDAAAEKEREAKEAESARACGADGDETGNISRPSFAKLFLRDASGRYIDLAELKMSYALPNLAPRDVHQLLLYVFVPHPSTVRVHFALHYYNQHQEPLAALYQFKIEVRVPFSMSFSSFGEPASHFAHASAESSEALQLLLSRPFVVHADVENVSGHVMLLHRVIARLDSLTTDALKAFSFESFAPQGLDLSAPLQLKNRERCSALFHVRPELPGTSSPGEVGIIWSRARMKALLAVPPSASGPEVASLDAHSSLGDATNNPCSSDKDTVEFRTPFPVYDIRESPVKAVISFPPSSGFGKSFVLTIQIDNSSPRAQTLILEMGSARKVCVSGLKVAALSLLPNSRQVLSYTITPLECNFVSLPVVSLRWMAGGRVVQLLNEHNSGRVFISPLNVPEDLAGARLGPITF